MNPITRDFIHRWNWLLLIQFAATTIGWIMHERGSKLHFEMFPAIAMSRDITRGLVRTWLGLPLTRAVMARGLWFSVAALSPVLTLTGMILATGFCLICGMTPPPLDLLGFHLVVAVLLSGTMQFLLTSLPTRAATTVPERIRDIVISLGWGLSISATMWISFLLPAGWEEIGTGGRMIMSLMAVLSAASWFTTRSMLVRRAMARPAAGTPLIISSAKSALSGASGWKLWSQLEMGALAPVCFMMLFFMGIMELMAMASSQGVSTAMRGPSTTYTTLGMMGAMSITPLMARAASPARAFRALPITREKQALLLACRPVIYCLCLFMVFSGISLLMGRGTGEEGSVFSAFVLIGSLMSLGQAVFVRFPRFPVAMAMGMFLAPMVIISLPLLVHPGKSAFWMAVLGLALFPVSWLLHRRWLRSSSQFYRSEGWLQRLTTGNVR